MNKKHLEKQHYILELKLKKAKNETDILRAHPIQTILIVLVFTFIIGPNYTHNDSFSNNSDSIMSRFGGNYFLAAVCCGIVCLILFLLYILFFTIQKKKNIKRLEREKKVIEDKLNGAL